MPRFHAAPHNRLNVAPARACWEGSQGLPRQERVSPESLQDSWPTGAPPSALHGIGCLSLELTHSGVKGVGALPTPHLPPPTGPAGPLPSSHPLHLPLGWGGRGGHRPSMALPVGLCPALGWHGVQSTQGPEHPHAHRVAILIFSPIFRQVLRLHRWSDLPAEGPPQWPCLPPSLPTAAADRPCPRDDKEGPHQQTASEFREHESRPFESPPHPKHTQVDSNQRTFAAKLLESK